MDTERPLAPAWWPDWTDLPIAIIASGPSVKKKDVAALRGRLPVLAIKENFDLAPWSDVVYGCDMPWWRNRNGLQEFKGLKISAAELFGERFQAIHKVDVQPEENRILLEFPNVIGGGGNSGFQALNLAVQFGADRILLVGFDMDGAHWYGRNRGIGRTNPDQGNFRRWRQAFHTSAPYLASIGVEVINASVDSSLTCFKKASVNETLSWWGR